MALIVMFEAPFQGPYAVPLDPEPPIIIALPETPNELLVIVNVPLGIRSKMNPSVVFVIVLFWAIILTGRPFEDAAT